MFIPKHVHNVECQLPVEVDIFAERKCYTASESVRVKVTNADGNARATEVVY